VIEILNFRGWCKSGSIDTRAATDARVEPTADGQLPVKSEHHKAQCAEGAKMGGSQPLAPTTLTA
jgi:hypothetical protein